MRSLPVFALAQREAHAVPVPFSRVTVWSPFPPFTSVSRDSIRLARQCGWSCIPPRRLQGRYKLKTRCSVAPTTNTAAIEFLGTCGYTVTTYSISGATANRATIALINGRRISSDASAPGQRSTITDHARPAPLSTPAGPEPLLYVFLCHFIIWSIPYCSLQAISNREATSSVKKGRTESHRAGASLRFISPGVTQVAAARAQTTRTCSAPASRCPARRRR